VSISNLLLFQHPEHTSEEWQHLWLTVVKPRHEKKIEREAKPTGSPGGSALVSEGDQNTARLLRLQEHETRFRHELADFAETQGFEVNFNPKVCGRTIRLFELYHVVERQDFGGFDEVEATGRWSQVAQELKFNHFKHSTAPAELRILFDETLADFVDAKIQFQSIDRTYMGAETFPTENMPAQGDTLDDEENAPTMPRGHEEHVEKTQQEAETNLDKNSHIPSSPPERRNYLPLNQPSRRRPADGSPNYSLSPRKKKWKTDKGKDRELEIPSTPEYVIGTGSNAGKPWVPSPLKTFVQDEEDQLNMDDDGEEEEEEDIEEMSRPVSRSLFGKPRHRQISEQLFEPETQDFHFSYNVPKSRAVVLDLPHQEEVLSQDHAAEVEDIQEDSSTDTQADEALQEFIDRHVSLGYTEDVVRAALKITTMETGDAGVVMEALSKGNGIPDNIQGVWTVADDNVVRLREHALPANYEFVRMKHGDERYSKRWDFLQAWDQAELENA
jgi:hypothetical protein